ncbi:tRNA pseudouridine(55) synthase TruB [Helicobacter anatolicus]|uniref:tRNA pseudouridine(55) synthase TruB n=1 Tax=Helicobacter anatolicus TaxID=2905874 RepID=UPI001E489962|nr:tRNA pseudouridine(55) synthase TruB [Helicobacter anatolicus]MCE3038335.1 tRNA pseudouridine(55) synthase TruB [Helicobacter anatolicus]
MDNLLLLGYKPVFLSSNQYLHRLKKKYQIKSGGYLGTLDPFAKGAMILAFGQYTRLLPHIKKPSKVYRATLWLGIKSDSLDIENIKNVQEVPSVSLEKIHEVLQSLQGVIKYYPPKFSAKHVNGKRAYDLARLGVEFTLKESQMQIYAIKLLSYNHPFLSFEVRVSSGAYVRSLGDMIAERLGSFGALSMLERVEDGGVRVMQREERELGVLEVLDYPVLKKEDQRLRDIIYHGKKTCLKNVKFGTYIVDFDDFFSIIEIAKDGSIQYLLNRINKC